MTRRMTRQAFTIVELLVACVIVATALTGVYSVLRQVLVAEEQICSPRRGRALARSVGEHLAEALSRVVNASDEPTIALAPTGAGGFTLTILVGPSATDNLDKSRRALQWRHYCWSPSSEPGRRGILTLKTLNHAGTVNITPGVVLVEGGLEAAWSGRQGRIIAKEIDDLSVTFKRLPGPGPGWAGQRGLAGNVMVTVRVTVGDEHIKAVVVPAVNAAGGEASQ